MASAWLNSSNSLRLLLRRHADAGVGDGELDPVAAVADLARPQRHLALLGELAGIAQEVEQDLPQPHRVGGERRRDSPAHSTTSRFLFCSASWRAVPIDLVDQRRKFDGLAD